MADRYEQLLRDILRRLDALDRTRPRLRLGEVIDTSPLDVALGGSDVAYENVKALNPVRVGDIVAVLVAGNDLLVLGPVGDGSAGIIRGTVTAPGAVLRGEGFTSANTGTGLYTVTFDEPFAALPIIVAGAGATGGAYAVKVSNVAAGSADFITYITNTAANADREFHFAAFAV
jgi:hypothetical protein